MAIEDIGAVIKTKIPGLADNANIQDALRIYHYGKTGATPATESEILPDSVAGQIRDVKTRVTTIEGQGLGSTFQNDPPSNIQDGYIWVDANSNPLILSNYQRVAYQNDAPTADLVDGVLWVDKNSSPLKMYVYDSVLGWREIGA